jgi:hypothetical protein
MIAAPGWVMFFDRILKPYGQTSNMFCVCYDVFLFTLAIVMILAFWEGNDSVSDQKSSAKRY